MPVIECRKSCLVLFALLGSAPAQFILGHSHPHDFASPAAGQEILFAASDGPTAPCEGMELWSLRNGIVSRVAAIVPGVTGSYPRGLVAAPSAVWYFTADDQVRGRELWSSTGALGTTAIVKDLRPGSAGSMPSGLTTVGTNVFFSANDGVAGRELWFSNGTANGTQLVDVSPGAPSSDPHDLVAWNGLLFFVADGGTGAGLWLFNASGPSLTAVGPRGTNPSNLTPVGPLLYLAATDATNGRELWTTDGTNAGTRILKDVRAGVTSSAPDQIRAGLGGVVFTALDDAEGRELWKSDGTAAGTQRISAIHAGTEGGHILELVATPARAWFQADDGTGPGLWTTTGAAPTKIALGGSGTAPRDLTPFLGGLVFSATTPANGRELWTSNAVTATMIEIRPGVDSSAPAYFFVDGSRVLFSAFGAGGIEPWSTNGITASPLQDIDPKQLTQPELHADSTPGPTLTLRYASGPPNGLAATILSLGPIVPGSLPLPFIIGFLRVDLTGALIVGIPLDAQGRATFPILIPPILSLIGFTIAAQGLTVDPITATLAFTDSLSAGSYTCQVGGGQSLACKIGTYKDDTWEHKVPGAASIPNATGQCYLGLVHRQWDETSGTYTDVLLDTWPYQPLSDGSFNIDGFLDIVPKLGTAGDKIELRYWNEEPSSAAGGCVLYVSYC